MTDVSQRRFCKHCGVEKEDKYCPSCKSDTLSNIHIFVSETIEVTEAIRGKIREGIKKPHLIFVTKREKSGDPKLPKGVDISMSVDRKNYKYDQVIRDVATGKITHEEHESLKNHKPKKK